MSWLQRHHRRLFAAGLVAVYAAVLLATGGLRFEAQKDEVHFWETTRDWFVAPFPPSAETLRSYPELITPLSYVLWGQLHRLTGNGMVAGRSLHLLMSLAIVLLLAYGARGDPIPRELATMGLLLYPYFLALGVHLYTDIIGAFCVVFGLHFHLTGHRRVGFLLFVLAISTRQYLVQLPAALAVWEGSRALTGAGSWRRVVAPGLACASLLGWVLFWGGLAPQPGLDRWISPYPAPMLEPTAFIVEYGLYFLVGIGVYFVVPEMLLFRRHPGRDLLREGWVWAAAAALAAAFLFDAPDLPPNHPGGLFGRLARWLLPGPVGEPLRMVLFYALALLVLLRFLPRRDLGSWIVGLGCLMSMKSQIPWEKYFLPCLVPLWYLRSRPGSEGFLGEGWEARSG